jgi:lysyl-tRNA synthetase class 2
MQGYNMAEENIRQARLEKLEKIKAMGLDPYGRRVDGLEPIDKALSKFTEGAETPVFVAGRISQIRDHKKSMFLDLHDRTGKMQIYIQKDSPVAALAACLDFGDVVAARGPLFKTRLGEITVNCGELLILSKNMLPPPEKFHGQTDVELRYRMRYVDLATNPESFATFLKREKIISEVRAFLAGRGYFEVETPVLHDIPGGAAARPFITHHNALDIALYMRIALELHLKRLLVGGMERVYEIGRVFRNEGIDTRHNPEFTMLELYEAYSDYNGMMEITESLISRCAAAANGSTNITFADKQYNLTPPFEKRTYDELFKQHVGLDRADEAAVREKSKQLGIDQKIAYPVLANEVFEKMVEGALDGPIFVMDYPAAICPLTKSKRGDPAVAERFELFIAGMEIANAFTELNDPFIQRKKFEEQLDGCGAEGIGKKIDEDFIRALEFGMPPAGGLGIGIDRLIMLITGRTSIRDVVLFPQLKPEE